MLSFSAHDRGRTSPIALVAHGLLLLITLPGIAMGQDVVVGNSGRLLQSGAGEGRHLLRIETHRDSAEPLGTTLRLEAGSHVCYF